MRRRPKLITVGDAYEQVYGKPPPRLADHIEQIEAKHFDHGGAMSPTEVPIKSINVNRITTDHRYQRRLDERRVNKMVREYDPRQMGVLEVSQRDDGTIAVFDGQHRLAMARQRKQKTVRCAVHKGLTPQEEAALFVRLQLDRKSPTPVERFEARVFYGEKDAVAIKNVVTECGFSIATGAPSNSSIAAILAVEAIWRTLGGDDILRSTLLLTRQLWSGEEHCTHGAILRGTALFLADYGHVFTEKHADRLESLTPNVLLRRARESAGSTFVNVAAQLKKAAGIQARPKMRS